MASSIYVGLAVSSHDATRVATATFDNVRVQAAAVPPPPPPPPANLTEIVLHAADAAVLAGEWRLVADATAASGIRAWNPNAGGAKVITAAAAPANFIELTFNAEAGRPYRLWIRGKAEGDTWENDSAHIQFSGTVDAQGNPVYRIGTTREAFSPFHRKHCWPLGVELPLDVLNDAARRFLGSHTFRAFAKSGQPERGEHCRVTAAEWRTYAGGVEFHVTADRFLHHMVRYMVGTMVDVARGRRPASDIDTLLSGRSTLETSPPAPPEGLFLSHVSY